MLLKTRIFTKKSTRRGSLTLELVLILPIIFLLIALIYQVSVMMMTHQAIQSAAMLATKVAKACDPTDPLADEKVRQAMKTAVQGWYFEDSFNTIGAVDSGSAVTLKYFFKAPNATGWEETQDTLNLNATAITGKSIIGVQVQVTNLASYKQYWLLQQFVGMANGENGTITGTACGVRK